MASIKRILSKKKWSGRDVGKTLLASAVHDFKNRDSANNSALLSQAEFERMESSLTTERDYSIYRVYAAMYEGIREFYNKSNSLIQQACHGLYLIAPQVQNCKLARKEKSELLFNTPLHLTAKQYSEKERYLKTAKESETYRKDDLIFKAISFFLQGDENKEPVKMPEAVQSALDALKNAPATNKQAIVAWQDEIAHGGRMLPDGRFTVDLTEEELETELAKHQPLPGLNKLEAIMLYFKGANAIRDKYRELTGESLPVCNDDFLELVFADYIGSAYLDDILATGRQDRELAETLDIKIKAMVDGTKEHIYTWKLYPLEDIEIPSKREVLADNLSYYEQAGIAAFKKDYPALYKALEQVILEHVPAWQGLTAAKAKKATVTHAELAEAGFCDFAEKLEVSERDIVRAFAPESYADHVAIVRHIEQSDIDESGARKEKNLILKDYTAQALAGEKSELMREAVELLINEAMRYINGFNAWIDILSRVYDFADLAQIKSLNPGLERELAKLNADILFLYKAANTRAERKAIKEAFPLLDFESWKPNAQAVKETESRLAELEYSREALKAFSLVNINATIRYIANL